MATLITEANRYETLPCIINGCSLHAVIDNRLIRPTTVNYLFRIQFAWLSNIYNDNPSHQFIVNVQLKFDINNYRDRVLVIRVR